METIDNVQPAESAQITEKKRPDFLTIICVLSFVWCGLAFILGIWGVIQSTPENMQKNVETFRKIDPAIADQMENQMIATQENTYLQIAPYLSFVYLLISFLGVLMMWKRNKKGFYIYTAGEILPYIPMLLMPKESMAMMGPGGGNSTIAMTMIGLMIVFDLVFIGMYAANLKHMK